MEIRSYIDPYGYPVINYFYTLDEVLSNPRIVRFRHMKPDEKTILLTWINNYRIDGLYSFGFELPRTIDMKELKLLEAVRKDAIKLTRLKIDCVLDTANYTYIIEVKDYLMTTAVSQPLIYEYLYRKYVSTRKITIPVLIYGESIPEIEEYASKQGIKLYNMHIPTTRKHIT